MEEPSPLKFTLFPKLPPELRNKIWEFALPGMCPSAAGKTNFYSDLPKTIYMEQLLNLSLSRSTKDHDRVMGLCYRLRQAPTSSSATANKSDIPVTLHVCRDSRAIALKHYSPAFRYRLLRTVYFDFDIDTLYLVDEYALRAFTQSYDGEYEEERAELYVRRLRVGIEFETVRGHPVSRIKTSMPCST
jgi:hypothetical protein